jgi:CRP/FNR family transcriptional regulator
MLGDMQGLNGQVLNNKKYRRGDYIYRQGDACKYLFVIKAGSAKSQIISVKGTDQVIGFHFSTEVMGLDALDSNKHASSVVVLENSIVCAFPRQLIEKCCTTTPAFQVDLIARFSREIVHEHQLLMLINKNTAEQRVAIFLLDLFIRMGFRGKAKIDINLCMSRADIANYLGLVPETVSRVLSKFERLGIIAVKKKKLKIIDIKNLSEYSAYHCHSEFS